MKVGILKMSKFQLVAEWIEQDLIPYEEIDALLNIQLNKIVKNNTGNNNKQIAPLFNLISYTSKKVSFISTRRE